MSRNPEARSNLRKLADSLRAEARTNLMILGHTDSDGSDSYNQQLSERRGRRRELPRVRWRGVSRLTPADG